MLGSYTSAIFLLGIAALMIFQSIERLMKPQAIHYDEAIAIAVVGLAVNLLCAWWLRGITMITRTTTTHEHDHDHGHDHATAPDLNMRSAYLHVLADAATSVLAIVALFGGLLLGRLMARSRHGPGRRGAGVGLGAGLAARLGPRFCSTPKWTRPWSPKCAR